MTQLGIRIVVVTFEAAPFVRAYCADMKITWSILIDTDRMLYQGYGMDRGRLWEIWGPRTWLAYARELAHGRWPRYTGADVRQLGGDVLVDPAGVVRLHHVGRGPADRPSVASIIAVRQKA